MQQNKESYWLKHRKHLFLGVVLFLFLFAYFKPWPYILYGPGTAESIQPRVETNHKVEEKGTLLFTTVATYANPNIFSVLYAKLNPRMEVKTFESATGGITNLEAYRNLQTWMRDSSETYALLAAFKTMKKPLKIEEQGVIVIAIMPQSKARPNGLQEGDIITKINQTPVRNAQNMAQMLKNKEKNDQVLLSGKRGENTFQVRIPLIEMQDKRVGIGLLNQTVLQAKSPEKVKFDFEDTGGPSAGLMMSLEIIAQLSQQDLTRGYRIAGTGTINADGTVGQIGGINYKLMAADREKADYFLVPYDTQNPENWRLAEKTVQDLNLTPKLVKVGTLNEALQFLKKLPSK